MSVIKKSSVLVAVFLGMFAGSARAQDEIVAKVPFPFVVRGVNFPAGRYDIIDDRGAIEIRGLNNTSAVFAPTLPADGRDPVGDQPALVFTHQENDYFLTQVWESHDDGLALRVPSADRRRAEAQPAESGAPIVVVAANWK